MRPSARPTKAMSGNPSPVRSTSRRASISAPLAMCIFSSSSDGGASGGPASAGVAANDAARMNRISFLMRAPPPTRCPCTCTAATLSAVRHPAPVRPGPTPALEQPAAPLRIARVQHLYRADAVGLEMPEILPDFAPGCKYPAPRKVAPGKRPHNPVSLLAGTIHIAHAQLAFLGDRRAQCFQVDGFGVIRDARADQQRCIVQLLRQGCRQ